MPGFEDRLKAMRAKQEGADQRRQEEERQRAEEAQRAEREARKGELAAERERVAAELAAAEAEALAAAEAVAQTDAFAAEQGDKLDPEARAEIDAIKAEAAQATARLDELSGRLAQIDAELSGLGATPTLEAAPNAPATEAPPAAAATEAPPPEPDAVSVPETPAGGVEAESLMDVESDPKLKNIQELTQEAVIGSGLTMQSSLETNVRRFQDNPADSPYEKRAQALARDEAELQTFFEKAKQIKSGERFDNQPVQEIQITLAQIINPEEARTRDIGTTEETLSRSNQAWRASSLLRDNWHRVDALVTQFAKPNKTPEEEAAAREAKTRIAEQLKKIEAQIVAVRSQFDELNDDTGTFMRLLEQRGVRTEGEGPGTCRGVSYLDLQEPLSDKKRNLIRVRMLLETLSVTEADNNAATQEADDWFRTVEKNFTERPSDVPAERVKAIIDGLARELLDGGNDALLRGLGLDEKQILSLQPNQITSIRTRLEKTIDDWRKQIQTAAT